MGPNKNKRRANLTEAELERMRAAEAEGKKRSEIAQELNVTPAVVTRRLGPVRPYRGLRRTEPQPQ
jgi:hypothetical protein